MISWLDYFFYSTRHPQVRRGFWVSVVAVSLCLLALIYWWPAHSSYQRLIEETQAKRREIVMSREAQDIANLYHQASQQIPVLERKLNNAVGQAELVNHLATLARQHGVKVLAESYNEGKNEGKGTERYRSLVVQLTLQGRYGALRQFMQGLSDLPVWSEIQDARLESNRAMAGQVKGQLSIVIFREAMPANLNRS